jgi:hypothetical protein
LPGCESARGGRVASTARASWSRGLTRFAAVFACLAFALGSVSAVGATLDARPDGTLLLTALGERFVVRAADAAKISVSRPNRKNCIEDEFGTLGGDPKPPHSLGNTLARWLVDPVQARCFESLAPTDAGEGLGVFTRVARCGAAASLIPLALVGLIA